jgi:hypothetical protein
VKKRLAEAKKVYTDKAEKFRKAVTEHLDKREEDARKAGNKKLVDQAKDERTAFEGRGEVPATCPPALLAQMKVARADLNAAFAAAVRGYLLLKEDAAAEAVEKEQQQFVLDGAILFGKRTYLSALKAFDVKVWNNYFEPDTKRAKVNGETVPHSIIMHPDRKTFASASFSIGGKAVVFHARVGVPKHEDIGGDPQSPLTFEVLGDGKALWKSEPVAKLEVFQTCAINVEKVRTLTLRVHCSDGRDWAHGVWFAPFVAE